MIMMALGRGRWAVSQKPKTSKLIIFFYFPSFWHLKGSKQSEDNVVGHIFHSFNSFIFQKFFNTVTLEKVFHQAVLSSQ